MNAVDSVAKRNPFLLGLWAETSSLTLLVSEWIWIAAIYTVLFGLKQEVMPVFVSLAIPGFLGYALSKVLHHSMASKLWLRIILAAWVLAALAGWLWGFVFLQNQLNLASLSGGGFQALLSSSETQSLLLQIILFLLMVRRSLTLPTKPIGSWQVVRSSQVGLLMFLIFGLTTTWDHFAANLLPFALYLFSILIALTSVRLAELSFDYGGRAPAFSRWWFLSILVLALVIVCIGSLSGWLLGMTFADQAGTILYFMYYGAIVILLIVLSPILILLLAVMPFLNELISRLVNNNLGQQQAEFIMSVLQPKTVSGKSVFKVMDSGLTIIIAVSVVIVILAIIFGVRLRRMRGRSGAEEELEDLAAVQKMLQNSQKKKSIFESAVNQAKRWLASARIRRIYALLMKSCANLNTPRPPSFTPLEFQPQLDALFPELCAETALLTNTYLKVRYGEYPELLDEMQTVHDAWERVKANADAEIRLRKKRMNA